MGHILEVLSIEELLVISNEYHRKGLFRIGVANLRLFAWFHAALTLILKCMFLICLLHLNSVRYFRVRGRYGGDIYSFHEFDVALCGITTEMAITLENAALSLSLLGHLWFRRSPRIIKCF